MSEQIVNPLSSTSDNSFPGPVTIGVLFLLAAVALNPTAIEVLLIPDQHLSPGRNSNFLTVMRSAAAVFGIWLLWRKPAISMRSARAILAAALGLAIAAGAYGNYLRMAPPPWQADGLPMTERLSLIPGRTLMHTGRIGIATYRALMQLPVLKSLPSLRLKHAVALLQEGNTITAIQELQSLKRLPADEMPLEMRRSVRRFLALAYLRLGEQENCIARHTNETCLLPMRPKGQHLLPQGSKSAITELTEILEADPTDATARWLLNIAYMTLGEFPDNVPQQWRVPESAFTSEFDIGRFTDVASRVGLDELSLAGGVIIEDFDQDGFLDVVVSSSHDQGQLKFFRNRHDGTFTDRTIEAGLVGQVDGLNLTHADYDNDGFQDILVLRGGWRGFLPGNGDRPNSLLRNRGDGTFTDVTEKAGLLSFHPSQTAAWGDFNNDGWLDVFIGNESSPRDVHRSQLYRNNGDGTFSEVASASGVDVSVFVKGASWGDYDNDGLIDLYISRYGGANRLYRNDGGTADNWSFTDVAAEAGVSEPQFSFPTWFWDFNNDGWLDIFVAGFAGRAGVSTFESTDRYSRTTAIDDVLSLYLDKPIELSEVPRLYRNNKDGTFTEISRSVGLDRAIFVMGANFGDLDNDGFLDLYLGTGEPDYAALMPNLLFRSDRAENFQDITTSAGLGHIQKGHGIAFADIDNDGDQDIYAEMGGWYAGDVFRNSLYQNPGHNNHWITIRLRGERSNSVGVGTRIKVSVADATGPRDIYATVGSGGSFGSSSYQQELGLGQASRITSMTVTWPASGISQTFEDVPMDRVVLVHENATTLEFPPSQSVDL